VTASVRILAAVRPFDVVANRFELERKAGAGGMGTVFAARDRLTGARVALKVLHALDATDLERFAREAELLASLQHPGIVAYVAHGATPAGVPWLAMEWLDGEDLAARLARGTLSVGDAVACVASAAAALSAAHRRGVVHRDVKAANLFLVDGDVRRVKVVDFGIARLARGARGLTRTGIVVGTPHSMAPEQARGERTLDARVDVWALGCVLFETLIGRPPFDSESAIGVLAKILLDEPPDVCALRNEVPEALGSLIEQMLTKDPALRPDDGADVARALEALGTETTTRASVTPLRGALGTDEQRLLCVVLVGGLDGAPHSGLDGAIDGATAATIRADRGPALSAPVNSAAVNSAAMSADATLPGSSATSRETGLDVPALSAALRETVTAYGGRVELLGGGALVATMGGTGTPIDHAMRAARCALAMHALAPALPLAVVAGRGVADARLPVGEIVERGVVGLAAGARAAAYARVRADALVSGLLSGRFELGRDAGGAFVRGELDEPDTRRTLLGRAVPFVGRERDLATLEATYDECAEEPVARVVLITAAAGAGKSRLVAELTSRLSARTPAPLVLRGRGDAMTTGAPFAPLARAVRRAADIADGEPLTVRREKLRARVARAFGPSRSARDVAQTAALLGELARVPFLDEDASDVLRAARRDPVLMADAMRGALQSVFAAELTRAPLVLVIDDLQWGDLPTVRALDDALRVLERTPLLVIAVARPEVDALFPALWADRELVRLPLGKLTRRAAEKLAREALGAALSDAALTRLVERADGNAFFLEELLRAEGATRAHDEVETSSGPAMRSDAADATLPDSVLGMVQARLDALDDDARRALRAASIFGEVFWRGGVARLLGLHADAQRLAASLDALAARELVARRPASALPDEEELVFRGALVREAAYASLTDDDRVLGHRLAGEYLEARFHEAGTAPDVSALVTHFERGGLALRALPWLTRAAQEALEGDDLERAIALAERGLATLTVARDANHDAAADAALHGALLQVSAEAHRWQGDYASARRLGEEAAALLRPGSAAWFAATGGALVACLQTGDHASVERLAGDASAADADADARGAQLVCLSRAALQFLGLRRLDVAAQLAARVDALAREDAPSAPRTRAFVALVHASRALFDGDPGTFLDQTARAIDDFDRAGDLRNACNQRVRYAFNAAESGDPETAESTLRIALSVAEQLGLRLVAAYASQNLGHVLTLLGRFDEARSALEAAIARAGDHPGVVGGARIYLAELALAVGDAALATREAERAATLLGAGTPLEAIAHSVLARARLMGGDASGAYALAARAREVARAGAMEEGETLVLLTLAEAAFAAGDLDAARSAVRESAAHVTGKATRFGDPGQRARFLERVPEHVRLRALAALLGAG